MRILLCLLVSAVAAVLPFFDADAMQCVAYARSASGIQLQGDAWRWWPGAAGLYQRGGIPDPGAVLVFARQGRMSHGHVAVVARVVGSRMVLVDHANWAPPQGRERGQVARLVPVLDVSPANDWSRVRVWHHPARQYGNQVYRTEGFVYRGRRPTPAPAGAMGRIRLGPHGHPLAGRPVILGTLTLRRDARPAAATARGRG